MESNLLKWFAPQYPCVTSKFNDLKCPSSLLRTHLQGYLDQAVPPEQVLAVAKVEAARLAPLLNPGFAQTKKFERGPVAQVVKDAMWTELSRIQGTMPSAKL